MVKAYLNDLSHGLASIAPQWTPKCHSFQVQSNTRLRQSWVSGQPNAPGRKTSFPKGIHPKPRRHVVTGKGPFSNGFDPD